MTHTHRCHICGEYFDCPKVNCTCEGPWQVCYKSECIKEWEAEDD